VIGVQRMEKWTIPYECFSPSLAGVHSKPSIVFVREMAMKKLSCYLIGFLKNEDGPTAVEYAVMMALIIVVCIVSLTTLGTNANKTYQTVAAQAGKSSS
jgi:pilus assembly protein Flp/PilA